MPPPADDPLTDGPEALSQCGVTPATVSKRDRRHRYVAAMSLARRLAVCAAVLTVAAGLVACSPPQTGTVGVGVDDSGNPVGFLRGCAGEHMDLAAIDAAIDSEPLDDNTPSVASWDIRPAATGSMSWSFIAPSGGWTARRTFLKLKPGAVYRLIAGINDNSGSSGTVLFTMEDLKTMGPGQVRIYDVTRQPPSAEPTGTLEQQARDENAGFMRVVSRQDFERRPCTG